MTTTKRTVTINYDGDYETVDDHRRKLNNVSDDDGDQFPRLPDICQGQFDAVSVLRNELFFFKDQVRKSTLLIIQGSSRITCWLSNLLCSSFGVYVNDPPSTTDIRLSSVIYSANFPLLYVKWMHSTNDLTVTLSSFLVDITYVLVIQNEIVKKYIENSDTRSKVHVIGFSMETVWSKRTLRWKISVYLMDWTSWMQLLFGAKTRRLIFSGRKDLFIISGNEATN